MAFTTIFRRSADRNACVEAYDRIVAQSRRPDFYRAAGVPDTVDGRFDLIALHAFLVLRRLRAEGESTAAFAQALFDVMFEDMDCNLREMGAGDLGVGRRVKAMAKAFYGRIAAYEEGLAMGAPVLEAALRRNLYRDAAAADGGVAGLAGYVMRSAALLAAQPADRLMRGEIDFGPPPAAGEAAAR